MDSALLVPVVIGPLMMLLIAGIARAAGEGRIPRNHAIGIRLRSTLASDAAWRDGHRAAARPAVLSTAALLIADAAAGVLGVLHVESSVLAIGLVVLLLLAIGWVVIAAVGAARRSGAAPG